MDGFNPNNPLIAQADLSILLEVNSPRYADARDQVARFAELVKSPEHIHTYQVSPLSLWNAAASGMTAEEIVAAIRQFSRYPVPENVFIEIREQVARYGRLRLLKEGDGLVLESADAETIERIVRLKRVQPFLGARLGDKRLAVDPNNRGLLKQALIKEKLPVEDLAGYTDGDPLDVELRDTAQSGRPFRLREYQQDAAEIFHAAGGARGGSGVLVLPCGAGKTVIGIATLARVGQRTLILTTNITALRQWISELLDKTTLTPDDIGEYSGEKKDIRPVTVSTYQLMTYRKSKSEDFVHMELFNNENWGLIVYDEVHMLPAPVFRSVANIQARRRLGLTATLVREDGAEDDVFSLIGPKKFDMPWKQLENQGWIATAECVEIRVPLAHALKVEYAAADQREQFRMASENPAKMGVIHRLIERHRGDNVMIIGQYIDQLEALAEEFKAPIITGKTPNREREEIYARFRTRQIKLIIVSKVANFAIDLPDANVAIQVSGTFGSRQEEAQRLGRVLRPKGEGIENVAHFYSVVTRSTKEQEFAMNRQMFLTQQGYSYRIEFEDLPEPDALSAPGGKDNGAKR
ncbi:MAG: helicase-associated domain-containing protein [Candidatus Sumerlaeia bacterium]|nr:helicase-associated domain-containing protein [Candidatus Sumerlaeia bacterium]